MPKFILFERLDCVRTNDRDEDELRLEILIDQTQIHSSRMILSSGQSWALNRSYQFENQVEVGLFDEDEQDNEDCLGFINLLLEPVHQTLTAAFDSKQGDYILSYRIELEKLPEYLPPPPPPPFSIDEILPPATIPPPTPTPDDDRIPTPVPTPDNK